jgi:hypothetical protein
MEKVERNEGELHLGKVNAGTTMPLDGCIKDRYGNVKLL